MSMRIYKYPLEITDKQRVLMPYDAEILSAQMQNGILCLWALVDPNKQIQGREIWIHGTGHPVVTPPADKRFIDTVQDTVRGLVLHVFEEVA